MFFLFKRLAVVAALLAACGVATAQPGESKLGVTPLKAADLDVAAYTQWVDGQESPITVRGWEQPASLLWTQSTAPTYSNLTYGNSKTTGIRYLRVGWKTPLPMGSVVVIGGGSLSVLKPDAAYPGKLNDDAQWIPAQRISAGKLTTAEVRPYEYGIWVLPPGTRTQALRFAHTPEPTDAVFGGLLGGAYVLETRFSNVAPYAAADASAPQNASLINNGWSDGWNAWQNIDTNPKPLDRTAPVSADQPEWVTLAWPQPVTLRGLNLLGAGFTAAQVQVFEGPPSRQPRSAPETDWKTVAVSDKLDLMYPRSLTPNWLDFGQTYVTRAVRLLMTRPVNEAKAHPHIQNKTRNGARVFLGELQALQPLGDAPLQPAAETKPTVKPHPPIPINFTLKTAGYVTLVIEGSSGKRVRNLVSETYFPAGANTAWWDGTDDLGRDIDAAKHGLYKIPAQFVQPGQYRVRGLVRDAVSLTYEFGVYTAGNPPWTTQDRTGAWLSNHSNPQAALYVPAGNSPAGKAAVLLGSYVSEGRDGLAWVGLDGRKQGGKTWIGGTWTGAAYLARDAGAAAVPQVYAYAGATWEGTLRLTALQTSGIDKPVMAAPWTPPGATDAERKANAEMGGLAAHDGTLAVSLPKLNQLLLINAKSGAVLGIVPVDNPRGLAYDAAGRLHVLSGTKLLRLERTQNAVPETVIAEGLQDPVGLALDAAGNFYISDKGTSHQVKVFDGAGKFVRAIGRAGAPRAGAYDPLHMNNPDGLTLDSNNHLWVAENDALPKRVSVWTLEGQLVNAFYGPSQYGGGGRLDLADKSRFYYGGMEFSLDWQKGEDKLLNVLYRPEPGDLPLAFRSGPPEAPLYHEGHRYFTNCYNSSPTGGHGTAFLFIEKNGVARPVAAMGRANDWNVLKREAFKASWPAGVDLNADMWRNNARDQAFFIWTDTNADAQAQPNEVIFQQGMCGGVIVMPDLSFCISRLNGKAMRLSPLGFGTGGVPRYDLAQGQVLVDGVSGPQSSGGDQVLTGEDGFTIATLGIQPFNPYSIAGAKNGVPLWSYPNPWPGLHASHEAARPDRPGQVIGATRLLGGFVKPPGSDAGQLWAVNGNMGNIYVFTADGLFVATLFQDVRQGKLWQMPVATRGMKLNGLTLHDENFWPSITQTPDGKIYLVDGGNSCILQVDGLESIRRLPVTTIRVGPEELRSAQAYQVVAEAERQSALGSGVLAVAIRPEAPVVDGKLDEWAGAAWADIDKSGVGANFNSTSKPYDITAAISVSNGRLYAAFRTGNADLLKNSGEMPTAPFKTGGALDIMLGINAQANPKRTGPVEGDLRLLVTLVKGKPLALIYRGVVPGTKTPVPFSSPWRTITLDRVDDVSDQVQLAGSGGNYELSVPLAALGLNPQPGLSIKGDVGVLRGDGAQTTARIYWSNKATGITADVPSEAMLTPNLWGELKFQ